MSEALPHGTELESAIAMLTQDHNDVGVLFRDCKKLMDYDAPALQREDLATRICNALAIHARVEDEAFCPAAPKPRPRARNARAAARKRVTQAGSQKAGRAQTA